MQNPCIQTFPAKIPQIATILQFLANWCSSIGLPETTCNSLKLIVDEIASNICFYGIDQRGDETITLSISGDSDSVVLEIADQGIPFNPLERQEPDTTAPLEERPIGGLGIFLVTQLADSVAYRCEEGRNILTVVVRINSMEGITPR